MNSVKDWPLDNRRQFTSHTHFIVEILILDKVFRQDQYSNGAKMSTSHLPALSPGTSSLGPRWTWATSNLHYEGLDPIP